MITLIQAAQAVIDAYYRKDGRAPILSVHIAALEKALSATPQRWTDADIDAKEEQYERWLMEHTSTPVEIVVMMGDAYAQALRDHALLSGEGVEIPEKYRDMPMNFMGSDGVARPWEEHIKAFPPEPAAAPPTSPVDQGEQIRKLQAFKDYVHQRLDEAGIPTHPPGEHSDAGCRVGQRLDIAFARVDQGVTMSREPIGYIRTEAIKELAEGYPAVVVTVGTPDHVPVYAAPSTREKQMQEALRKIEGMPHCQVARTVDQCPGCVARKALESLSTDSHVQINTEPEGCGFPGCPPDCTSDHK